MSKLTDSLNSWFRRRKVNPVSPEDAEDLADWANEGGAIDPQGPPPVKSAGAAPEPGSGGARIERTGLDPHAGSCIN